MQIAAYYKKAFNKVGLDSFFRKVRHEAAQEMGGALEACMQVQASNHLMLLW